MSRSFGPAAAVPVAVLALLVPLCAAGWLSWKEGVAAQQQHVLAYALEAMRHGEETAGQFNDAVDRLQAARFTPCSPAEINLMRELDISGSYIQAVGRVSGNKLVCDSLGSPEPIALPPPSFTNARGTSARLNVRLPIAPHHPFILLSRGEFAVLIEPTLPIDLALDGPDNSVGIFVPSLPSHDLLGFIGAPLNPRWFRSIQPGESSTFLDGNTVVGLVRSRKFDMTTIATAPETYLFRRMRSFAIVFIPVGLACGLAIAWAMLTIFRTRYTMRSELRSAIRRGELSLAYQPIVELATGDWIGAEALVRWKRSAGEVPPAIFIPVAEQNGLITAVTQRVFKMAADDLPHFLAIDSKFQLSINLAAEDLVSLTTVHLVAELLGRTRARASNLKVEATERGFLQGDEAQPILQELAQLGVGVAIDDFGTGHSSLSRLQTLTLDTLKIDKAFIDTIGTDGATSQVVLHIIEMAHSLGLSLVAEGVETREQAAFLQSRGVQCGQGYFFGRPQSAEALCEALARQKKAAHPV